jgi:hypothetical protein
MTSVEVRALNEPTGHAERPPRHPAVEGLVALLPGPLDVVAAPFHQTVER